MPLWFAGGNPSSGPARRESDGGGVMKEQEAMNSEETTVKEVAAR